MAVITVIISVKTIHISRETMKICEEIDKKRDRIKDIKNNV